MTEEEPDHAVLSPSSAERWIQCPASVRMAAAVAAQPESPYAVEGTAAHALAEIEASLAFRMINAQAYTARTVAWRKQYGILPEIEHEMMRYIEEYVALLRGRWVLHPFSQIMLEQRLPTGLPDGGRGTSDAVIVSPTHVEIVDFKYGQGVRVDAENNPQLRLYAYGALVTFGDLLGETKVVRMTVHQPRLSHVLVEELTADQLRAWHASILPAAEEALTDHAHFGPSDTACRWCAASGQCKAQLQAVFQEDFEADPAFLTPQEMGEILGRVPLVREWLKAFEEVALDAAYSRGQSIPGWKVVLSGGKRSITDAEATIKVLVEDYGYSFDEVARLTPRGIGDLEKLLGKEKFRAALEAPGLVKKGEGRPSLVPEDDGRSAIEPNTEAAKVFSDESPQQKEPK